MVILKQSSENQVGVRTQVFSFTHPEQSGTSSASYGLTYSNENVGKEVLGADVVATFGSTRLHVVNDASNYGSHRYGFLGPWTGTAPHTGGSIQIHRIGQGESSYPMEVTVYFKD